MAQLPEGDSSQNPNRKNMSMGPEKKQRIDELLREARMALQEPEPKQIEAALALYNQVLEIDPENLSGVMGRCTTLQMTGRMPEAKSDANRALSLGPRDHDYLSLCPVFEGEERREFIKAALQALPSESLFRDHLRKDYVQSYWQEGNVEAVVELLKFQDKTQGLDDHERWKLGQALEQLGRTDEAAEQYDQTTYSPSKGVSIGSSSEAFSVE